MTERTQSSDDARSSFEDIAARLDYPMLIATVKGDDELSGCLVGFAAQCSISPARFMVFISEKNHTYRSALGAAAMGVHVVPEEQEGLARLFGETTGDDLDKFERCQWASGVTGTPMLMDCPDRFEARIIERFDVGDHAGFLLEPVEVHAEGSSFFPFQRAKDFEPGHEA